MKRLFAILGTAILLVACAQAPAPRTDVVNAWSIERPFDDVWQAAIEAVPEMGLEIDKAQIETGLITSVEAELPERTSKQYADWGKLSFTQFQKGFRGKFNIYVRKTGEGQTELKMISVYKIIYSDSLISSEGDRDLWERPAVSTGKREAEFYALIRKKLGI